MPARRIAVLCFAWSPALGALLGLMALAPPASRESSQRHLVLAVGEPDLGHTRPGEAAISWHAPTGLDFARLPFDTVHLRPSASAFAAALTDAGFVAEEGGDHFARPRRWSLQEQWTTWAPHLILSSDGSGRESVRCGARTANGGWRCPRGVVVTPDLVRRPEGLGGAMHTTALPAGSILSITPRGVRSGRQQVLHGSIMVLGQGVARASVGEDRIECAATCEFIAPVGEDVRIMGPTPPLALELSEIQPTTGQPEQ